MIQNKFQNIITHVEVVVSPNAVDIISFEQAVPRW